MGKPQLLVTVFSDYICPFCYIGNHRLSLLRAKYDFKVYWRFIEIHPETPIEGQSVDSLGYQPDQWRLMMDNLRRMAEEDGLKIGEHLMTANSHRVLLLAEAAKELGSEIFYRLNDRIYSAYFTEGKNLGDEKVLTMIAEETGVPADIVQRAWSDPKYEKILTENLGAAIANQVSGTPTFFFGEKRVTGAVPLKVLQDAAEYIEKQKN